MLELIAHEVLVLFGGLDQIIIYCISVLLAAISAFGRGFLLHKPPLLSQRFADSIMCGVLAIPITGIALTEHELSVWWIWATAVAFGSLGFLAFYELIHDLVPAFKEMLVHRLTR